MTKYLDKLAAWLMSFGRALTKLGGGKYLTLPFGNGGRGTRVYLWPFVAFGIVFGLILFYDLVIR